VEGDVSCGRLQIQAKALTGEPDIIGFELNADPVAAQFPGDELDGAGSEERVEHDAWAGSDSKSAARPERAAVEDRSPGLAAIAADQRRAGREDRAADQLGWEGSEVRSPEASGGNAPHVAGVLAEWMAGQPGRSRAAGRR
jgi:hypothetical protein